MLFDPSRHSYVLMTSTTYGNWLPGDKRGYVDKHNEYGTPFDQPSPMLERLARTNMKETTVLFDTEHAEIILERWLNTAGEVRGTLLATAIMCNHFHIAGIFIGTITKAKLLQFFKGRASRALNQRFGKRTWWTDSGSVRYSFEESLF